MKWTEKYQKTGKCVRVFLKLLFNVVVLCLQSNIGQAAKTANTMPLLWMYSIKHNAIEAPPRWGTIHHVKAFTNELQQRPAATYHFASYILTVNSHSIPLFEHLSSPPSKNICEEKAKCLDTRLSKLFSFSWLSLSWWSALPILNSLMKGNCQNQNAQTKDSKLTLYQGRSEPESKALIGQEKHFVLFLLMAKCVFENPLKQKVQYRSLLFQ